MPIPRSPLKEPFKGNLGLPKGCPKKPLEPQADNDQVKTDSDEFKLLMATRRLPRASKRAPIKNRKP